MSLPLVPHTFRTGEVLDVERLNEDLLSMARDVQDNLDQRFTYSAVVFPIDGLVDTDPVEQRRFRLKCPATGNADIVAVELRLYAASGASWSVASSDTSWPGFTVAAAGATTKAVGFLDSAVHVATSDVYLELSASAGSTITKGELVVHLRADRHNQGVARTDYEPTLLSSASSTAGSVLDTELLALEAAVTADTGNDKDRRPTVYRAKGKTNASPSYELVWRIPDASARIEALQVWVVAANTITATWTLKDSAGATVGSAVAVVGAGTSSIASSSAAFTNTQPNNAPTDSTKDYTLTLTIAGGSCPLTYATVWMS